jgi:hypothetical protein
MPWRCVCEWSYNSTIPDLSTRWRWVVSFTPPGKSPRYPLQRRTRGSVVVEAICYKPEGLAFDSRWVHWTLSLYLLLPVGLGSYRHLWTDCLDNMGSLASHSPIGLHGLLRGYRLAYPLKRRLSLHSNTAQVISCLGRMFRVHSVYIERKMISKRTWSDTIKGRVIYRTVARDANSKIFPLNVWRASLLQPDLQESAEPIHKVRNCT